MLQNNFKNAVIDHMIEILCRIENKICIMIVAKDTCKNGHLSRHEYFKVKNIYFSKKTRNLHSFLTIYKEIKVILIENCYLIHGLINDIIDTIL